MESGKKVVTIFLTENPKKGTKSYDRVKNRAQSAVKEAKERLRIADFFNYIDGALK